VTWDRNDPWMLDRAMTYGLCPHCGWPRTNDLTIEDGVIVAMSMGCTNPDCDKTRIFVG
jgi:hypothetical protein